MLLLDNRLACSINFLPWLDKRIQTHHFCMDTLPCVDSSMITSSNGNIFRVTGHLCAEFTGPRWIPHTKASDVELWWVFFYLRPYKRLSKQSQGWWFETLSRLLWRQCNDPRIRQPLSFLLPRICTLCHTSQELKTIKFVMFSIMAISYVFCVNN